MTSIFTKISVFKCQYYKYEINSDIDVKNRKYEKLKIYGDDPCTVSGESSTLE